MKKKTSFPSVANVLMDTTYFGRKFGVMVFKDSLSGTILFKQYVRYETNSLYLSGIKEIVRRGNLTTMGVYTLLSNLVVAFMAPIYFSFIGGCAKLSFWGSFGLIFAKIAPVLILPFILAVSIQKFSPTLNTKILKLQFISFYLWALALTVVIAKIINFILNQQGISLWFMIGAGILALIICIIQFALGKYIGNRYGDKVAGGQSLGQKNTVLAIWMSQTYLNPISSIIPAIYVILQNVYNSMFCQHFLWLFRVPSQFSLLARRKSIPHLRLSYQSSTIY
jgi:predicted Na+-dependent transporter